MNSSPISSPHAPTDHREPERKRARQEAINAANATAAATEPQLDHRNHGRRRTGRQTERVKEGERQEEGGLASISSLNFPESRSFCAAGANRRRQADGGKIGEEVSSGTRGPAPLSCPGESLPRLAVSRAAPVEVQISKKAAVVGRQWNVRM